MLVSERKTIPTSKAFDPLAYAKLLETNGFTRQQAEILAEEQNKLIDERLATKTDIELIRADIATSIAASESKLLVAIEKSKSETIRWMLGTVVALGAFLYGVARLHG